MVGQDSELAMVTGWYGRRGGFWAGHAQALSVDNKTRFCRKMIPDFNSGKWIVFQVAQSLRKTKGGRIFLGLHTRFLWHFLPALCRTGPALTLRVGFLHLLHLQIAQKPWQSMPLLPLLPCRPRYNS